jgi:hypothetical protein
MSRVNTGCDCTTFAKCHLSQKILILFVPCHLHAIQCSLSFLWPSPTATSHPPPSAESLNTHFPHSQPNLLVGTLTARSLFRGMVRSFQACALARKAQSVLVTVRRGGQFHSHSQRRPTTVRPLRSRVASCPVLRAGLRTCSFAIPCGARPSRFQNSASLPVYGRSGEEWCKPVRPE